MCAPEAWSTPALLSLVDTALRAAAGLEAEITHLNVTVLKPAQIADVADQPGAGQQLRLQPGPGETFGDPLGSAVLGIAELGVGVQVAAEGDEPGFERLDHRGQRRVVHSESP